jgi:hypothetical protein
MGTIVIPAERAQRERAGIHSHETRRTVADNLSATIVIMDSGFAAIASPRNDERWCSK